MHQPARRIVLTGGPGAGKTVVSQQIAQRHPDRIVRVPEAATQVYQVLGTRWDRLDIPGRRDVQRRIYRLQVEQQQRFAREHPDKVRRIYLRNVTGESAESPRIQSALRGVMKELWRLFDKPEELASDIWNR